MHPFCTPWKHQGALGTNGLINISNYCTHFIKLAGWQLSGVAISWMRIFPGGNLLCGNYPGGKFLGWRFPWWELSGWESSGWDFSWVVGVHEGIFRVGVFLGGSCLGGSFPGWELSRWDLSWVGIFFGGSFLGGNCPVGIIRVVIFKVGVFMLPYF